jgi:VIT1/CCC1 family predicted Fe2+/Mn2+ transporter
MEKHVKPAAPVEEKYLAAVLAAQKDEITEYHVYTRLAKICGDSRNAEVLASVAKAELRHAMYWKGKTGTELKPDRFRVWRVVLEARVLGLTFILKRMEKNEGTASRKYGALEEAFPEIKSIIHDEAEHESSLLSMLDEERLRYIGSIVLGLNDALVELTGALAGFTLTLGGTKLVSMAGLVTGISAAFSMGASEYLSSRAENKPRAGKSALYTGAAYIITVALLILPFLFLSNKFAALGITMALAVLIIFVFNYYLSVARDLKFKRRFAEMSLISLGVAALSFAIGWLLNKALGA